jgi:stalled ribosome alternative rescue factor ArfA
MKNQSLFRPKENEIKHEKKSYLRDSSWGEKNYFVGG